MMADDFIKVALRIRPQIKRELKSGALVRWGVTDNVIYFLEENGTRSSQECFTFDHVFGTNTTNKDIYNEVKPIVQLATEGINGTVFAYGQTSSGKTHSIIGTEEDRGIIPRAIDDIFTYAENNNRKFLIRAAYFEIYNEKINDLLNSNLKDIKIREDLNGTISVKCTEEITRTREELMNVILEGNKKRQIGETNMNERSSRSHVIFKIVIESSDRDNQDMPVQVSNLYLVDLAGSERVAQTKATGVRLKEGSHINKTLSALSLVMKQLSSSQEHVSFRDSKLTRILSNALGGNSKTLIIATVTPVSVEHTLSTLQFAKCAKAIKNQPRVNKILSEAAMIKQHQRHEKKLLMDLEIEKAKNITLEMDKNAKEEKIQALEDQLKKINRDFVKNKTSTSKIPKRRHTSAFERPVVNLTPIKECRRRIPCIVEENMDLDQSNLIFLEGANTPELVNNLDDSLLISTPVHVLKSKVEDLTLSNQKWRTFHSDELMVTIEHEKELMAELGELKKKLTEEEKAKEESKKRLKEIEEQYNKKEIACSEAEIELSFLNKRFTTREKELLATLSEQTTQNNKYKELETQLYAMQREQDYLAEIKRCADTFKLQLETLEHESIDLKQQRDDLLRDYSQLKEEHALTVSKKQLFMKQIEFLSSNHHSCGRGKEGLDYIQRTMSDSALYGKVSDQMDSINLEGREMNGRVDNEFFGELKQGLCSLGTIISSRSSDEMAFSLSNDFQLEEKAVTFEQQQHKDLEVIKEKCKSRTTKNFLEEADDLEWFRVINEKYIAECQRLGGLVKTLDSTVKIKDQEISALKDGVHQKHEANSNKMQLLSNQYEVVCKENVSKDQEIENLNQKIHERDRSIDNLMLTHQNETECLKKTINQNCLALEEANAKLAQLSSNMQSAEEELCLVRRKLCQSDEANDNKNAKMVKQLKEKLCEALNESDQSTNDLMDKISLIEQQEAKIKQLLETTDVLKKENLKIAELEKAVHGLNEQLQLKTTAIEQFDAKTAESIDNISRLEELLQVRESELKLRELQFQEQNLTVAELKENVILLEDSVQEKESELSTLKLQFEEKIAIEFELAQSVASLKDSIEEKGNQLNVRELQLEEKMAIENELKQNVTRLENLLQENDHKLKIQELQMKDKNAAAHDLKENITRLQNSLQENTDKLNIHELKIEDNNGLKQNITRLESLLQEKTDELKIQELQIVDNDAMIHGLKENIAKLEKLLQDQNNVLTEKNNAKKLQEEKQLEDAMENIFQLKTQLEGKNETIKIQALRIQELTFVETNLTDNFNMIMKKLQDNEEIMKNLEDNTQQSELNQKDHFENDEQLKSLEMQLSQANDEIKKNKKNQLNLQESLNEKTNTVESLNSFKEELLNKIKTLEEKQKMQEEQQRIQVSNLEEKLIRMEGIQQVENLSLKEKLLKSSEELEELRVALDNKELILVKEQRKIQESLKQVAEIEGNLTQASEEIRNLKEKNEQLSLALLKHENNLEQINTLQLQLIHSNKENESYKLAHDKLSSENCSLQKDLEEKISHIINISQSNQSNSNLSDQNEELKIQVLDLQNKAQAYKCNLQKIHEESSAKDQIHQDLNYAFTQAKEQIKNLETLLNAKTTIESILITKADELSNEIEAKNALLRNFELQNNSNSKITALEQHVIYLREESDKLNLKLKTQQAINEDLIKEISLKQIVLTKYETCLSDLINTLNPQLNGDTIESEDKLEQLPGLVKKLLDELNKQHLNTEKLEVLDNEIRKELQRVKEELVAQKEENKTLDVEVVGFEEIVEELKKDKESMQKKIDELKEQNLNKQNSNSEKIEVLDNEGIRNELQCLKKELEAQMEENRTLNIEVEGFEEIVEELKKDKESLQRKIDELKEENEHLDKEVLGSLDEINRYDRQLDEEINMRKVKEAQMKELQSKLENVSREQCQKTAAEENNKLQLIKFQRMQIQQSDCTNCLKLEEKCKNAVAKCSQLQSEIGREKKAKQYEQTKVCFATINAEISSSIQRAHDLLKILELAEELTGCKLCQSLSRHITSLKDSVANLNATPNLLELDIPSITDEERLIRLLEELVKCSIQDSADISAKVEEELNRRQGDLKNYRNIDNLRKVYITKVKNIINRSEEMLLQYYRKLKHTAVDNVCQTCSKSKKLCELIFKVKERLLATIPMFEVMDFPEPSILEYYQLLTHTQDKFILPMQEELISFQHTCTLKTNSVAQSDFETLRDKYKMASALAMMRNEKMQFLVKSLEAEGFMVTNLNGKTEEISIRKCNRQPAITNNLDRPSFHNALDESFNPNKAQSLPLNPFKLSDRYMISPPNKPISLSDQLKNNRPVYQISKTRESSISGTINDNMNMVSNRASARGNSICNSAVNK